MQCHKHINVCCKRGLNSALVYFVFDRLTQVVLDKGPLNVCVFVCAVVHFF